jgi:DNA-binding CsgD family transcriptional regulator
LAVLGQSEGTVLVPFDVDLRTHRTIATAGVEAACRRYLSEGWHRRDLRANAMDAIRTRGYGLDSDVVDYDEIERSPYYQDLLKPHKLRWFIGLGIRTPGGMWCASIQRDMRRDAFSDTEARALLAYGIELSHAASITQHLEFQRLRTATDLLEAQGKAVVLIGPNGEAPYMSRTAERLLDGAVTLAGGRLRAANPADRFGFERLISHLGRAGDRRGAPPPARLSREGGGRPLAIFGARLPEAERVLFLNATALLVIHDPDRAYGPDVEFVVEYFDVTSSEASLALALCRGETLEAYASARQIQIVTARNHLQSLLRKTGMHSKAELVALILRTFPAG